MLLAKELDACPELAELGTMMAIVRASNTQPLRIWSDDRRPDPVVVNKPVVGRAAGWKQQTADIAARASSGHSPPPPPPSRATSTKAPADPGALAEAPPVDPCRHIMLRCDALSAENTTLRENVLELSERLAIMGDPHTDDKIAHLQAR